MKTFGIICAVALGLGSVLYFGGYVDGKVDAALTQKGKQTVANSLESMRTGVNDGLKSLTVKVNEGLENVKIQNAPQINSKTPQK